MRLSLLFAIAGILFLSACDLRRPDDGYDSDWKPDREAPANDEGEENAPQSGTGGEGEQSDDPSQDLATKEKRPGDITADTARMAKTTGTWEMVGKARTTYTVYKEGGELAMILEKAEGSTRAYYFNGGALFYYNETSVDGSQNLTVEFDDIGDVIGARKTVRGERVHAEDEDYAEIVKHAVELKMAAEKGE